jgi:hypothetical protein
VTLDQEVRDTIAEVVWDAIRTPVTSPWSDLHNGTRAFYRALADAIVAKLAEGAWERGRAAAAERRRTDCKNADVSLWLIAATLGLDPSEVPT